MEGVKLVDISLKIYYNITVNKSKNRGISKNDDKRII